MFANAIIYAHIYANILIFTCIYPRSYFKHTYQRDLFTYVHTLNRSQTYDSFWFYDKCYTEKKILGEVIGMCIYVSVFLDRRMCMFFHMFYTVYKQLCMCMCVYIVYMYFWLYGMCIMRIVHLCIYSMYI